MQIIAIVGPMHSGSTLLFNMVRMLLEHAGYRVESCWCSFFERNEYDPSVDFLIVKTHGYIDKLKKAADHIFLTLRDMRDIAILQGITT